jgi:hypothetical protein
MDLSGRSAGIIFTAMFIQRCRLTPLFKVYFPLLRNGAAVLPTGFTREIPASP